MRLLIIGNLVIPEFCDVYSIKIRPYGGWISGMISELKKDDSFILGCCFPIIDEDRMKNGISNGIAYYSFRAEMDTADYNRNSDYGYIDEFIRVYEDFEPDIVYVMGTEYAHARIAAEAANYYKKAKVVIHIQGLVTYYEKHYMLGIPADLQKQALRNGISIFDEANDLKKRGKNERWVIENADYIFGRTEWDEICCKEVNSHAHYYHVGEILRSEFYDLPIFWSIDKIKRHQIFLSQASYPIKGLHLLLPAIYALKKEYPDINIRIGGRDVTSNSENAAYSAYICNLIRKYELLENVQFLGELGPKEMIREYLEAHIFVSPSTIENSANSIGEAMMVGCPVIASYVGGTPSLIEHRKSGILYQCDASYMLAGYIREIFQQDSFASNLSRNAVEVARKRYGRKKLINEMKNTFLKILEAQKEK